MPESAPRHIVAAGALVSDPHTGRVLLIRGPRRGWEFPGGQIEEGESLIEGLIREVREETGLTISVGALVGVYSNTFSRIVMFGFLCEWTGEGQLTPSAESLDVEWVPRSEALARVTRPPLYDRLRDMLEFDGTVVYCSYAFNVAGDNKTEYVVQEERPI